MKYCSLVKNKSLSILLGIIFLSTTIVIVSCRSNLNESTPIGLFASLTPVHNNGMSSTSTPGLEATMTFSEVRDKWLSGIPCSPPCWEGITPGKSTSIVADEVLGKNNLFTNVRISTYEGSSIGYVSWELLLEKEDNDKTVDEGFLAFDMENDLILAINAGRIDTSLGKLIQIYDEPDHIVALLNTNPHTGVQDYWHVDVIWISLGFRAYSDGPLPTPKIDDKLMLQWVQYFVPGQSGYLKANNPNLENNLRLWQGFANFEVYRSDSE